mmetsp:Transcript_20610/g.42916  ORF Transcript_20610/g.42916 Transcript_20610/m.42916 type:complete len:329 (-) Transcript_20610:81-1067(-)
MISIASQRRDPPRVDDDDDVDDDVDDERRHGNRTSVACNDDEIHDGGLPTVATTGRQTRDLDGWPTVKNDDVAEKDPAPTEETLAALATGELAGPARETRTKKEQSSRSARDNVGRHAGETISETKRSRPGESKSREHPKPPPRGPRRQQENRPKQLCESGRDVHDNGDDDDGDLPDMTGKIITVDFNNVADEQRRRRPSRKGCPVTGSQAYVLGPRKRLRYFDNENDKGTTSSDDSEISSSSFESPHENMETSNNNEDPGQTYTNVTFATDRANTDKSTGLEGAAGDEGDVASSANSLASGGSTHQERLFSELIERDLEELDEEYYQ